MSENEDLLLRIQSDVAKAVSDLQAIAGISYGFPRLRALLHVRYCTSGNPVVPTVT